MGESSKGGKRVEEMGHCVMNMLLRHVSWGRVQEKRWSPKESKVLQGQMVLMREGGRMGRHKH
jgi:hypothetical protein